VASGLTRLVAAGRLPPQGVIPAWRAINRVPIRHHVLQSSQAQVVEVAMRLRRQSAYDAAYIVLAQQLEGELWTLDGPLARNAAGIGFPVRLIT
jgi:predicted nucleic acid-binding protein